MDNLILELIELKFEKTQCIRNQEYQKAAHIRDNERILQKIIYHIILGNECDKYFTEKLYKETVDNYIMKKYGFDYSNIWVNLDDTKEFIRELKLKILGI